MAERGPLDAEIEFLRGAVVKDDIDVALFQLRLRIVVGVLIDWSLATKPDEQPEREWQLCSLELAPWSL